MDIHSWMPFLSLSLSLSLCLSIYLSIYLSICSGSAQTDYFEVLVLFHFWELEQQVQICKADIHNIHF